MPLFTDMIRKNFSHALHPHYFFTSYDLLISHLEGLKKSEGRNLCSNMIKSYIPSLLIWTCSVCVLPWQCVMVIVGLSFFNTVVLNLVSIEVWKPLGK